MLGRISFIILTLAILVLVISAGSQSVDSQETRSSPKASSSQTSSSSQTTSSFNGYDLADKTGNIRSRPLPVSRNLCSDRFQPLTRPQ